MTADAEALHTPIASNPDISGIGVRIAAYAQIAITSVLLSYLRHDFELSQAVGQRICILAVAIAIASAWQCRTTGLSSLDTVSSIGIQFMMGMYGSTLARYPRRGRFESFYFGWLFVFVAWVMITPLDLVLDVWSWWFPIILLGSPFVCLGGMAIVSWFNGKRDKRFNPLRVQPAIRGLCICLPGPMACVELAIYNNIEARDLNQWTYGQMLPMLLLALPIFELLPEIWKRRSLRDQVTREGPVQQGSGTEDPALG